MPEELLHKTITGLASEFPAVFILALRAYNVTLRISNLKAIDLLIQERKIIF